MKRIFIVLAVFAFLLSFVSAQDVEEEVEAGKIPGDFGYGFDVFFDRAFRCGVFGNEEKCLRVAEERLAETEELVKQNKLERIEESKERYNEFIEKFREKYEKRERKGVDEEIFKEELRVERKIMKHEERLEIIAKRLEESDLTDEQIVKIKALISSFKQDIDNVDIKIRERKGELRIRIRERIGEERIEDLERPHWEIKAKKQIAEAEKAIEQTNQNIERFVEKRRERFGIRGGEEVEDVEETDLSPEDSGLVRLSNDNVKGDTENKNPNTNAEDEMEIKEFEEEFEDKGIDEIIGDSNDDVFRKFGISLPEYDEKKGLEIAKMYIAFAIENLRSARVFFDEGKFEKSYAYAGLSRKAARKANSALSNGFTDEEKELIKKLKERAREKVRIRVEGLEPAGVYGS